MKKYISIILVAAASWSCTKALDTVQQNVVERDAYYANATDSNAESLIAVVYKESYALQGPFYLGMIHSMSDDAMTYSTVTLTSANNNFNNYYAQYFRINYLCNLIVDKMSEDSATKRQVKGEAYFWRAWVYLNLIRGWGTPPLADHVLEADELTIVNAAPADLWNYVFTSLEEAIARLPEKAAKGAQGQIGGRVTKGSANALLGKAKVLSGDYAGALAPLEAVIGSGKYALIDDYRQLYHHEADFCDEYMWEFNAFDGADVNTYHDEGDTRAEMLTWSTRELTVPGGLDSGNGAMVDVSANLHDFFVARGEERKPRALGTIWSYEETLDRFVELGLAPNRQAAVEALWGSAGVTSGQGFFRSKMLPWKSDIYDHPVSYSADRRLKSNWPGMRYAEVLLLYAEACAQTGSKTSEGLNALNQVRRRAGLSDEPTLTLPLVKDEKRAEMVFEGERFFDLVRWGDAPAVLAERGLNSYRFRGYVKGSTLYDIEVTPVPGATGFQSGKDELFPFPYSETVLNPDLKQNQGW